jgi:hypothetical protein
MNTYHIQRAWYLEPDNVLWDCQFADDSMVISGWIVSAYLLNKRNLITTVSIIHTILMCDKVRILKPL